MSIHSFASRLLLLVLVASGELQAQQPEPVQEHAGHQDREAGQPGEAGGSPRSATTPVPALTDADRAAAIPPATPHSGHGDAIQDYLLLNRLEVWDAGEHTAQGWEAGGWLGGDIHRLWMRSEGERLDANTEQADLEVMYSRSIARWWDVLAGVRHDFEPGPSRTFASVGIQGLAPQWFETRFSVYLGEGGRTAARFEVEYELLFSNRLVLQPLFEADLYGEADDARGIGSGLSTTEAGLRMRYEITRRFAPYIGVSWERAYGDTATLRREAGESTSDARFILGVRAWF